MSALQLLTRLSIVSLLWSAPLVAQNRHGGAVPAARGVLYHWNVGAGYSYVNMNLSGNPAVSLHGIDTNAVVEFLPRWAATMDASYVRAGRDAASGHSSYVLSVLAGPVFVPVQNENNRFLVRALAGMSLVDSSVRVNDLYYRGWQSRFSWAIGTGIEHNVSRPFAVRFTVDYLRTKFIGPAGTLQPQNGIRVGANLVFRFSDGRATR